MRRKTPNAALSKLVTEAIIEALQDIERLHVCRYAPDAASTESERAILLGISRVDNDKDGDGFRYLIGLRRGTKITPHLSCFF
jgi:hypothetical protein